MKLIQILVLSLLASWVVSELSLEQRRKRAQAGEHKDTHKEQKKQITKRAMKAYREVLTGSVSRDDSKLFFSMVPQRLVRRYSVRFITIILSRIQWQNCATHYDPRYCRKSCANGAPIGSCPQCPEGDQSQACVDIRKEKECLEKFTYYLKNENPTDAACCKYSMTQDICDRRLNPNQVSECCKDKTYQNNPLCTCSYVIYHQQWFLPERVVSCCSEYEIKNNRVHPLCKTHCSPLTKECCAVVFKNPLGNWSLYGKCCKEFSTDPACDCNTVVDNKSIGLYPEEKVKECCYSFLPSRIPEVCRPQICPTYQLEKQECCSYYFTRQGVSQTWIQNCCKHKEYSSLDACEDCDCRNNIECCDRSPYKSTEFCTCYRQIGKDKVYRHEQRDCFCKVYPNHPLCTCGNECCNQYFITGDYSDKLKYSKCCAHPSVTQDLKDKYCLCNENTIPSQLPDSRKLECCINKEFILQDKNKPACCSYVLSVLDNQYIDESYKKMCCQSSCDEKCKSLGYCGDDCKENTVISEKCCLNYKKRPFFFKNQYTECCRKNLLDCKCEYIYSHIDEYGINHPMVKDCCSRNSPTPDPQICANYCNQDTPENETRCCHLIVAKGLQSYSVFKDCCKMSPFDKTSVCQSSDCSTSEFKYPCCTQYINDYSNKYDYYKMCCAYQLRLQSQDKTISVSNQCDCAWVLSNKDFFKQNDPARLAECDREDCVKKFGEKVCNCHDKYKKVPLPAGTIEECCPLVDNAICNDCNKLLTYLPALKNLKQVKSCCHLPEFFSSPICSSTYDCSTLPFNYHCCPEYFRNPTDYSSTYTTGTQLAYFTQFRSHCCYHNRQPDNFKDCPKPDCTLYPTSLACCNTYDGTSKYRQDCCMKTKQEFPDAKGICLCSDNRRKNDPECCKYGLEPTKCCTGQNPSLDYSDSNRQVCCAQRFNPQFCCYSANWDSLSLDQKKQCCAHSYVPGKCCKVNYSSEHCCNNGFFSDQCCKDDISHIDSHTYRLKCCSQFRSKLNEKRSKQLCEPCLSKSCGPIYPPHCLEGCPMSREKMIKENCQCPPPNIIIPPHPIPPCNCPSEDPRCNCPPPCPICPHSKDTQYTNMFCQCPDDDCDKLPEPKPIRCKKQKCKDPYTDFYMKDGKKVPCIPWPYPDCEGDCTYPLICLKKDNCIPPLPPVPTCKGSNCCFVDHKDDKEALYRCLCKYPEFYSREFCSCVLFPTDPKCDCLLPYPNSKCCLEKNEDLCSCSVLFRKYGSRPISKEYVYLDDQAEWQKCCNKYFGLGFCDKPPVPPVDKCPEILAKAVKSNEYLDCCTSLLIGAKGNDQIVQGEAYKTCCRSYYPGRPELAPYCQQITSCTLQIIKDKRHKDKAECCSIHPFRNMPECNVCNQPCVYQPPTDGSSWHSKFVPCCNNYPQKQECCKDYDKIEGHPLKTTCCARDPKCCANGKWKDITHTSHYQCCEQNLNQCCPLAVQTNPKHPDHAFCCARMTCPSPPKCKQEDYKKDSPTQCKCCKETYIPELCCECSDCYQTYLAMEKDIKKFDVTSKEYIKCCLQQNNPPEVCTRIIDPCVDVLTKYDLYVGTAKWKECCERRKDICPSPEMCYDSKNICADITHKYYPNCCTPIPEEPCYQNVFKNVLHPYWDYCCRKYNFPKPWCDHKPNPPCIDEPCDEKDEMQSMPEEHFNQSGVLLTKGRLRKRKQHHHHHDL